MPAASVCCDGYDGEISATGADPEAPAAIVNAWTDAYQALRQRETEREAGDRRRALEEELATLGTSIAAKRQSLDAFRAEHDIVTLERDGNEALARLGALTADLNRARDEALEAESRLAAVQEAIARGDPVVPPSDMGDLQAIEEKAVTLRARLIELKKRFTPLYLENEPDLQVIPAQLADLEAEVARRRDEGRDLMLTRAEQEVEQSRRRVQSMEADLVTQKEAADAFTTSFGRYEAMQKELARLEELSQETQSSLVELRAKAAELSCHQDIAGSSAFSLGMIARFREPVTREPFRYRHLFWECGMIGQVLYLGAEAAGVRGTGIGCFFDDPVHRTLGLPDNTYQSLYHFTVGVPVDDPKLTTYPPYHHLKTTESDRSMTRTTTAGKDGHDR